MANDDDSWEDSTEGEVGDEKMVTHLFSEYLLQGSVVEENSGLHNLLVAYVDQDYPTMKKMWLKWDKDMKKHVLNQINSRVMLKIASKLGITTTTTMGPIEDRGRMKGGEAKVALLKLTREAYNAAVAAADDQKPAAGEMTKCACGADVLAAAMRCMGPGGCHAWLSEFYLRMCPSFPPPPPTTSITNIEVPFCVLLL